MAMKFASCILIIFCSLLFGGCNTATTKNSEVPVNSEITLLSSEQFIPAISRNKDGVPQLYEPTLDPYSEQKGRINKLAITKFIEAKRAFNSDNFERSEILAKEMVQEFQDLSGPWVILGDIAARKSEIVQAEEHYKKALLINETNINAYLKLALSQRQQGQYLIAQNTYVQTLEQWPDFPEAHLNLAILYDIYLNHPIRAQRHYEAYQFLTKGRDAKATKWLAEVKARTGLGTKLNVGDDQAPLVVGD